MLTFDCAKWLTLVVVLLVTEDSQAANKNVFTVVSSKLGKMRQQIDLGKVKKGFVAQSGYSVYIIESVTTEKTEHTIFFTLKKGKLSGLKNFEVQSLSASATRVDFKLEFKALSCTYQKFTFRSYHVNKFADLFKVKTDLGSWSSDAAGISVDVSMAVDYCVARVSDVTVTSSLQGLADCRQCQVPSHRDDGGNLKHLYTDVQEEIKQKLIKEIRKVLKKISVKGLVPGC